MATKADIAWAAGFYEGEGSAVIRRHKKKDGTLRPLQAALSVAQNDHEPLERFAAIVGGGSIDGPYGAAKISRWRCYPAAEIRRIAMLLYPWLTKRRQAQIDKVMEVLDEKRK